MYQKNLSRDLFYTTGIFMGRSYFWKILSIQKDPKLVFIPNLGFKKKTIYLFFVRKKLLKKHDQCQFSGNEPKKKAKEER